MKWKEKMNQLRIHILFSNFLENYCVSEDQISKHHLNVIKKSNFVKEDKTIVRSTHPPLEIVLITCKKTKVKASSFKIVDDQTPIISLIQQNNFTMKLCVLLVNSLTILKKKLMKKLLLQNLRNH